MIKYTQKRGASIHCAVMDGTAAGHSGVSGSEVGKKPKTLFFKEVVHVRVKTRVTRNKNQVSDGVH